MDTKKMGGGTSQQETASGRNTKIKSDYPPDHSGVMKTDHKMRAGQMGGSVENLSHSLSGASAKQRGS